MSKLTISRIFWGSLGAIAAGLVVLAIAAGLGFATTGFTMRGPDIVGVQPSSTTWVAASVGVIAVLALIAGALGQFVAWVGALVNTAQLQDKVWFLVLLLLGIVGLGFVPMLVYVLAGPDRTASVAPVQQAPAQPATAELPKGRIAAHSATPQKIVAVTIRTEDPALLQATSSPRRTTAVPGVALIQSGFHRFKRGLTTWHIRWMPMPARCTG